MNSRGARGTINLFQCGSNEQGEDKKKGLQFKTSYKFWSSSQKSCDYQKFLSEDEKKEKVFSPKLATNSGHRLKILAIFHEFLSESQKKKKKRSSFQNFSEIRCESTKITQIRAINTYFGVLGFDLHSGSPEPVNFFGAQSSLGRAQFLFGGAQAVIWGGTAPECPPVAPGLDRSNFDDHVDKSFCLSRKLILNVFPCRWRSGQCVHGCQVVSLDISNVVIKPHESHAKSLQS